MGTGGKMEGHVDGYKDLKDPFFISKDQKRSKLSTFIPAMQGNLPLFFKETKLLFLKSRADFLKIAVQ